MFVYMRWAANPYKNILVYMRGGQRTRAPPPPPHGMGLNFQGKCKLFVKFIKKHNEIQSKIIKELQKRPRTENESNLWILIISRKYNAKQWTMNHYHTTGGWALSPTHDPWRGGVGGGPLSATHIYMSTSINLIVIELYSIYIYIWTYRYTCIYIYIHVPQYHIPVGGIW